MITPKDFVDRWGQSTLREQQAAQSHFNELCQLVGHRTPTQIDPEGTFFTFEENVAKATGGKGRADVWYKGHFAWEYKGKHKDLDAAYAQLLAYKGDLDNPPLLVVCDFLEYRIYPQWTNTSAIPFKFTNEDLLQQETRSYITWLLESPNRFLEARQADLEQREKLTLELARKFAQLADLMREHKNEDGEPLWTPIQIARFLTKLVFALFAEDVELLPHLAPSLPIFRYLVDGAKGAPQEFVKELRRVFEAMDGQTSHFIMKAIPYFDGNLFAESAPGAGDGLEVLDLTQIPGAINLLGEVSEADWRFVNPTIFGTLFEGALDTGKRAQLGAHYTGESDIRLVIEPVLMQPLYRIWDEIRVEAEPLMQTFLTSESPRDKQTARDRLTALHDRIMDKLANTRVLDPACGSGNFLYMSLRALKDLEGQARDLFSPLGLPFRDVVTPRQLFGIEKDEFAARLAYVVVWIGYLQWRYENEGGVLHPVLPHLVEHPRALPHPILRDKFSDDEPDRIGNADAIMRYDENGTPYEPEWPEVDVIVGNPPFLGTKKMRGELGLEYVTSLHNLYRSKIPGFSDLVCYWHERARGQIEKGKAKRAGLLATNSIRGGENRKVLERIKATGDIFMAWSDRDWVLEGAAVNISIIGFDNGDESHRYLDGQPVQAINPDLTQSIFTVKDVRKLQENENLSFMGDVKAGSFDISNEIATSMLDDTNPSRVSNQDVLTRTVNAKDITARPRNMWCIDFGVDMPLTRAQLYQKPYEYVERIVKPEREKGKPTRPEWWLHMRPGISMRNATAKLRRQIVTPGVAKHRIFVFLDKDILPDHALFVFAREDDYFFGVLHSYAHEIWSLRLGTSLEDRPRYTPTTTFETFPFPYPPGKEDTGSPAYAAISAAAQQLHEEREAWLNPPELIALGAGADSKALKDRTLTNLYNALVAFRETPPLAPLPMHGEGLGEGSQRSGEGNSLRNGLSRNDPASAFAPRLAQLHDALVLAVLSAYGWVDLFTALRTPEGDEELLRRLLALNLERAAQGT